MAKFPGNRSWFLFCALTFALQIVWCGEAAASDVDPNAPVSSAFFEKHVRPLLAETCFECHGAEKQKSGLRLDSREAFEEGGKTGPVVDRENLNKSPLIVAIERTGDMKMPPETPLPEKDVKTLREWVLAGAPWPDAEPPVAPAPRENTADAFARFIDQARASHWSFQPVGNPAPPDVAEPEWVSTPVDAFVLAGLESQEFDHAGPADARTLVRRLSYDLTGLPPDPADVEAYIADSTRKTYAKLVDKYLASPRYGERWARHWLDVARYADTKGYVFQEERAYPYSYTYRDYVVRAFNTDKPYDEFVREQIAADLLPEREDKRSLAALGFLTLGRRFLNNVHDIVDDRIDVVTRGMQGLSVSCARCHDHKYDPIASKDYYALYGVFRSTHEPEELPLIEDPDPEDPVYNEFVEIRTRLEQELAATKREIHVRLLNESRKKLSDYLHAANDALAIEDAAAFRVFAQEQSTRYPILERWRKHLRAKIKTPDAVWRPYAWYMAVSAESFTDKASEVQNRIQKAVKGDNVVNPRVRKAFEGEPPGSMDDILDRYVSVFETVDAEWRDELAAFAQIRAQRPDAPPPEALANSDAEQIRVVLYGPKAPPNVPENKIYDFSDGKDRNRIKQKRLALAKHRATHPGRPDRAPVLRDSGKPFNPYVFKRGKPGNRGEKIPRRYLEVLADDEPESFESGSGRLELAKAIADRDNPLTARVFVNRVWQHHFGAGLVRTPSDFGTRGDPPSHPELLDYLARYFMDHDWSVKKLHKLIVMSNTYRQSSEVSEKILERDPENRLLSHQNRRRLDYESIRDSLLAVAGELNETAGGPARPFSETFKRRTIYGEVVRGELPAEMKAFDFASPDLHAPKRAATTVPQQALYLMNSPFVNERARALEARIIKTEEPLEARIDLLFTTALQRAPTAEERRWAKDFVTSDAFEGQVPADPPPAWRYGCGALSPERDSVQEFHEFTVFKKNRWQPAAEVPAENFGWAFINRNGGHPGKGNSQSAIRRWTAPRDGVLKVSGELVHKTGKGNGVVGCIVSANTGLLGTYRANNSRATTAFDGIPVVAGETVDFVLTPDGSPGWDGFSWKVKVVLSGSETDPDEQVRTVWDSATDFRGPKPKPPEPLGRWAQLAQAVLCTNEFMYID